MTAVDEMKKQNNESLDFIIRDEDVADVPDDDDHPKINQAVNDGNKTVITISSEAGFELHQHWLDQGISGLMAAVVTHKINANKLNKEDKRRHRNCTKSAKSVTSHAKCVVTILDKVQDRDQKLKMYSDMRFFLQRHKKEHLNSGKYNHMMKKFDQLARNEEPSQAFRVKRNIRNLFRPKVRNQDQFELIEEKHLSPVALIARRLTSLVRSAKKTDQPPKRWQQVIQDIKSESERLKKKKKSKDMLKKKFSRFIDTMKNAGLNPKNAMNAMGMEDVLEDDPVLSEKEELLRDRKEAIKNMTPEQKMMAEPIKLIREGVKLGMVMAGHNTSDFDEKTISLISPRLLSVLPDENNDTISLLSPSLLSMHGEGTELERKLSLMKALKLMADTGQEEWMNFVFEAAGVTEAVDMIRDAEVRTEREEMMKDFVSKDGQPMYFTKENVTEIYGDYEKSKIETFERLHDSLSPEQMEGLNQTGYTIMEKAQLHAFYGPGSPFNDSEALQRLTSVEKEAMPALIETHIRQLAKEELKFEASRKKDVTLTPTLLLNVVGDPVLASQPFILSPIVLSSLVLSPSIYGAVILSPWVFVPVIVAPRILGPVVLSPVVFAPIVLSPLALIPVILTPGVGLPLILSPFLMTPFILSPVVMAPLILSPFCLSPFILVPNALTPMVLSPFVLSPLILSPPFVSAFVLNPYALSPVVASNGALFTAPIHGELGKGRGLSASSTD
ncbi:unnamed protein product [Caenorhabditis auriculariae]|uniref:Uncharacterized protein n=1 Tax=Caenorhabditis auriculariae TaxID=2777116 RepID=A0A8S1H775_9PELO|nr:unnamed protein product [Caenorhabditis auriculariae]